MRLTTYANNTYWIRNCAMLQIQIKLRHVANSKRERSIENFKIFSLRILNTPSSYLLSLTSYFSPLTSYFAMQIKMILLLLSYLPFLIKPEALNTLSTILIKKLALCVFSRLANLYFLSILWGPSKSKKQGS